MDAQSFSSLYLDYTMYRDIDNEDLDRSLYIKVVYSAAMSF